MVQQEVETVKLDILQVWCKMGSLRSLGVSGAGSLVSVVGSDITLVQVLVQINTSGIFTM